MPPWGLVNDIKKDDPPGPPSKGLLLVHIIKKDRFKMAAVVGLSTSLSKDFVRMECI